MRQKTNTFRASLFAGELRHDYERVHSYISGKFSYIDNNYDGKINGLIGSVHKLMKTEERLEDVRTIDMLDGLDPTISKYLENNLPYVKRPVYEGGDVIILVPSSDQYDLPLIAIEVDELSELEEALEGYIVGFEQTLGDEYGITRHEFPQYVWCLMTELAETLMH